MKALFARHVLPLIRDLIDQYIDEQPDAAMHMNAFYGWLLRWVNQD